MESIPGLHKRLKIRAPLSCLPRAELIVPDCWDGAVVPARQATYAGGPVRERTHHYDRQRPDRGPARAAAAPVQSSPAFSSPPPLLQ